MDKKRLKVALVVLDAVKSKFLDTKEFTDDTLKGECQKEKTTGRWGNFFTSLKAKISSQKHFLFF